MTHETNATTDVSLALSQFIREMRRHMNSGAASERLFEFAFDSLGLIIPYDRIGIALVEGQSSERRLISKWVKSKLPVQHLKVAYSAPVEGSSLLPILETGKPRIIDDLELYLAEHPQSKSTQLILKDGIRSSLTCPLRAENRSVGVVFFSSTQPNTYRAKHARFYLDVAEELSLIVEQSRLRAFSSAAASKDQSFRMALHDLKSPLGIIQGYIELATDEDWFKDLGADAKGIFAALNRNARYMADLLNELSELIQLDRHPLALERRPVVLEDFIAELSEYGHSLARKKQISFATETREDLPATFDCDSAKIRRAIDNLFTNAIKYSNRGTVIRFSVRRHGDCLDFSVQDQGQGIPESELPKLFSEFGKTSVRPTEGESSSGLGLAIVRKIASQHNGRATVVSEVGRGSTFTLSIPL